MKYLKYTYVDSITGIPVTLAPASNGPVMPDIPGLTFEFALESEYPTSAPIMIGSCANAPKCTSGVLAVLTHAEFAQARSAEIAARATKAHAEASALFADLRWRCETSGTVVDGRVIETDRTTQAMLTGAAVAATLDPGYSVRWKTADGFVTLSAEQIITTAQAIRAHVQSCFDREAELLDALNAGNYDGSMLDDGWPDATTNHQ